MLASDIQFVIQVGLGTGCFLAQSCHAGCTVDAASRP